MKPGTAPPIYHRSSHVRKSSQHDDIFLESPYEARMGAQHLHDARLIQERHHLSSMAVNICRNLIAQEWTFGVPAQDDLVMRLIPHQSQRVDPAIERTPVIDR